MEFVRFDTTYLLKWNMWEKCGGIRKIREYLLILYCTYEEVEILNWIHRLNKKNFVGRNIVMFDKNLLLILISFKSLNEKNFKFFLKKKVIVTGRLCFSAFIQNENFTGDSDAIISHRGRELLTCFSISLALLDCTKRERKIRYMNGIEKLLVFTYLCILNF